ncbi:MAG: hypothetical protein RIS70_1997 [Planctomycetota bacterium]
MMDAALGVGFLIADSKAVFVLLVHIKNVLLTIPSRCRINGLRGEGRFSSAGDSPRLSLEPVKVRLHQVTVP